MGTLSDEMREELPFYRNVKKEGTVLWEGSLQCSESENNEKGDEENGSKCRNNVLGKGRLAAMEFLFTGRTVR